jgi:hypothetical protein
MLNGCAGLATRLLQTAGSTLEKRITYSQPSVSSSTSRPSPSSPAAI